MADDKLIELERRLSAVEGTGADLSRRVVSDINPKIAALETRAGTLEACLAALQAPTPPPPRPPTFLERLNTIADPISKVLIPLAVVWMTWAIKDSVDSALKERELEVTTGKAMQDALTKLRANPLNSEDADAAALVLASMGEPSIMFLISEYQSGTVEATIAVEKALFILGLTHQP